MAVTLYTSRIVLQVLGVEDFGIYNVVGGIISLFSFINGGMIAATQRYITFEIGHGDKDRLKKVFCTALQIHAIISLIIIFLGETVGLWFLYEKMVIPDDRMKAALWVYQCSIIACIINIMSVPYNADIIAHEKMSTFAYISIAEVLLKLVIVYLLVIISWDKLVIYAILVVLVQLFVRSAYTLYCHKHFEETIYYRIFDVKLFREMAAFASWSFWGNLAGILYTQGLNLMLNVFFGPTVNAARGIAVQVQGAVQQFVSNFQMALNPQITKSYANDNFVTMYNLMFRSARFSFFLLFFIALPILLDTNFLLKLWLKNVPDNAAVFTQIMILISLIYTAANPCVIVSQATGKVKVYQLVISSILLTILPISYIFLKSGAPAYTVFIVHFCVESIAQVARMCILKRILNIPLNLFVKKVYMPIFLVVITSILIPLCVYHFYNEGWVRFILLVFSSIISVGCSVFMLGLTIEEKSFIVFKINQIFSTKR